MESRIANFESRWQALLPGLATKADVAEMKAAIAASESSIVKWLAGIVVAAISVGVGVMLFAFSRISPPIQPAPAPAPIIIYPQVAPQPAASAATRAP